MGLRVNGSNQYGATLGYKGVPGATNRTESFWFKGTYHVSTAIYGWGTEASGKRWTIGMDASGFFVSVYSGYRAWTPDVMFDGNWHHVAIVLEGSNVNQTIAYLDSDVMAIAGTVAKEINTGNTIDVRVGRGTVFGYADMDIFDFRIYSDAKDAGDIGSIFTGRGCDNVDANLEARHKFDAESGVCASEVDLSGNDRTLTTYNNPVYVADTFNPCGGKKLIGGFGNPLLDGVMV